ncbi:glutaredoxin [Seongchinamella sediminis]|uniref:Glutaredoxin n=1 Tax=Seongchinamella sediminis TaxID=2283635 RepID=A0A3L7DX43_9GAMM|nr:glutathione S-transferase N-terminal domain-containing protein [Seongchinamella sediminis]RLQ21716.1 glutaredoxin [Seongchinamella sediminis]
MQLMRLILGKLILFFNWVFSPKAVQRDAATQAAIDAQTARLALYQYEACPFCVKVRRSMKRNGLNIETRDVKRSDSAREELLAGGGNLKVPCLRIEEDSGARWMYESNDIIGYLEGKFAV